MILKKTVLVLMNDPVVILDVNPPLVPRVTCWKKVWKKGVTLYDMLGWI